MGTPNFQFGEQLFRAFVVNVFDAAPQFV